MDGNERMKKDEVVVFKYNLNDAVNKLKCFIVIYKVFKWSLIQNVHEN